MVIGNLTFWPNHNRWSGQVLSCSVLSGCDRRVNSGQVVIL